MKSRYIHLLMCIAFLAMGTACTRAPAPQSRVTSMPPTPAPIKVYPPGTRTGIQQVDDVIAAALAGDIDAMRQLVRYTITGCTKSLGLGGPPKCEYGEVEGTQVEVFPILGSEGGFVRRPSIDRVLQFKVKGLYGVYRVPPNVYKADYWPSGRYGIVLIGDKESALTLLVEDEGIVRIVYHMQPLEMALKQDGGEWLLPPPTASPASNVLPTGV